MIRAIIHTVIVIFVCTFSSGAQQSAPKDSLHSATPAIILGVTAYLLDGYFNQNSLFMKYRDEYAVSISADQPSGNLTWKLYREFYRDQRDVFAWWLAVTYFIQIADAFVDAHLFDFDVSDTKHVHAMLAPGRISLSIRF